MNNSSRSGLSQKDPLMYLMYSYLCKNHSWAMGINNKAPFSLSVQEKSNVRTELAERDIQDGTRTYGLEKRGPISSSHMNQKKSVPNLPRKKGNRTKDKFRRMKQFMLPINYPGKRLHWVCKKMYDPFARSMLIWQVILRSSLIQTGLSGGQERADLLLSGLLTFQSLGLVMAERASSLISRVVLCHYCF